MRTIDELVSREAVLRGDVELKLQNKAGDPVTLKVTALKRSDFMALMRKHPSDWDARLADECSDDATILDCLDLESLAEAQMAAGALCMGLPAARGREKLAGELASMLATMNADPAPASKADPVA